MPEAAWLPGVAGASGRPVSPIDLMLRPARAWVRVRKSRPGWAAALLGYGLPLTLLPAVAWPLGRYWTSDAGDGRLGDLAVGFLSTLLLTPMSLVIVAAAIFVLAPFFEVRRDWDRAVAVSVYASTPVLLFGVLLVYPMLVVASIAALLHGLVLCSSGLRVLLGCRARDCPAFVASVAFVSGAGSMVLGALCSAIGWV